MRQSLADEDGIDELAILGDDISEPASTVVSRLLLQSYPPMQHELREPLAGVTHARRPRSGLALGLRHFNPEKLNPTDRRNLDRPAVRDRRDKDRIRPRLR
jgi:hypothetical protein